MRIGIYGGSFDPVHYGHLILAERCREEAKLDQVWFVPSCIGPHKRDGSLLTNRQRVELINFAIAGHDAFSVSDIELKRGGVSYTIDTLNEVREQHADDELFLMMGADSLANFHTWKDPAKICELAIPLVVNRPGSSSVDLDCLSGFVDDARLKLIKDHAIDSELIDISSTDIRERVASGKSVRFLMPRAVQKYIETQKLYLAEKTSNG